MNGILDQVEVSQPGEAGVGGRSRDYLKSALIAWEVMRLIYSVALVVTVWMLVPSSIHLLPGEWLFLLGLIVAFNILFCLGPVLECVLYVFFNLRLRRRRYVIGLLSFEVILLVSNYFRPTFYFLIIPAVQWLHGD